jgi:hypothetical protein
MDPEELMRLDALAKMLVVGLPVVAVVTYHKRLDRLTIDVWSQVAPATKRLPQKRTWSVKPAEHPDLHRYVRERITEFLSTTGPWFFKP